MALYEIKYWFWHTFRLYWWRNGYRRLKRFIAWFPIIWRDEDWDSAYLFEIMRFKLSRLRISFQKNNRHHCCDDICQQIRITEVLLERFAFNDVLLPESGKRYPEFCSCMPNNWRELTQGWRGGRFCKYCVTSLKNDEKIKKDLFKLLWKNFEKHSLNWWD